MFGMRVIRTFVSVAPPGLCGFCSTRYRCLTAPAKAVAAPLGRVERMLPRPSDPGADRTLNHRTKRPTSVDRPDPCTWVHHFPRLLDQARLMASDRRQECSQMAA